MLCSLICILIGIALGYILASKMRSSNKAAEDYRQRDQILQLNSELASARSDAAQLRADLAQHKNEVTQKELDASRVSEQIAQARLGEQEAHAARSEAEARLAAMEAQRDAAIQRAQQLAEDRKELVLQFKNLSHEALSAQNKQAEASAEQRLNATRELMNPVQISLQQLNERITEVEKERSMMTASLKEQVKTVVDTGENLRRETNALAQALRKPHVRGRWGELQLKRVAEISGMVEYCDFYEQTTTDTAEQRIRPDMKVMIGSGKFVYVDSKVPLAAFLEAAESDDERIRDEKFSLFADHVKNHIDQLSSKRYWTADIGSPEFVVLFIPSEALAAEALSQRPDLNEYAATKNIIVATPTTLIALLRSVAYGWRQARLAESAADVYSLARELYERMSKMGDHFNKLGRSLQSSVSAYNQTLGSLEGRVMVSARKLRDLKVSDQELKALKGVDEATRPIAAPELLASAISPDSDEIIDSDQPKLEL